MSDSSNHSTGSYIYLADEIKRKMMGECQIFSFIKPWSWLQVAIFSLFVPHGLQHFFCSALLSIARALQVLDSIIAHRRRRHVKTAHAARAERACIMNEADNLDTNVAFHLM